MFAWHDDSKCVDRRKINVVWLIFIGISKLQIWYICENRAKTRRWKTFPCISWKLWLGFNLRFMKWLQQDFSNHTKQIRKSEISYIAQPNRLQVIQHNLKIRNELQQVDQARGKCMWNLFLPCSLQTISSVIIHNFYKISVHVNRFVCYIISFLYIYDCQY